MSSGRSGAQPSQQSLSEFESKALLGRYQIPCAPEQLAPDVQAAQKAAEALGFPVVLKLCGSNIAHKTERGLVRLGLRSAQAVGEAAEALLDARRPEEKDAQLLVAKQLVGQRELIAGIVRDPTFGPCVVLGVGGIFAEALSDVAFAPVPLSETDAEQLLSRLQAADFIRQPFRGEVALNQKSLIGILLSLSRIAQQESEIESIDINPLMICDGEPIAVDALVVQANQFVASSQSQSAEQSESQLLERFKPLFHPRGVIVAGVSTHPGKFGFVALHNLLRCGYTGEVFPVQRDGAEVLGLKSYRTVSEIPEGRADLVFVCTPNQVNEALLKDCAAKGVRAAFIASGGYGEAGEEGRAREASLVKLANELNMVVAGPNGQGVVSTSASLCAQIVAPYPPAGRIAVVSQSGNLVSAFMNYAVKSGVGVSKAISCGNAAQTQLADYLEYFAEDPETDVVLSYLEGIPDGEAWKRALGRLTRKKPLVLLKGGVAEAGKRAALSHTGSLASDDRIFDGVCAKYGVLRAPNVEQAFEWAASFATQPLPVGDRVVVLTTAGGWGVLAADACAQAGLNLISLPQDVSKAISEKVPARWSRNNPVDLAGGETRDTIPEVLELLCAHAGIDAVIELGLGIQAAQAHLFRSGDFFPDHGLERIATFHERQDARYARAACDVSQRHGKPVLLATELVDCDRHYGNAGPLAVQSGGRLCFPSAQRAVSALSAMLQYAEFRRRA